MGPASRTTATTLGTYSIPISPDNTNGATQPLTSTGIIVPAGVYYRVRVNGSVVVTPNPAHQAAYPGHTYPAVGTYGPGGTANWELSVSLATHNTEGSGTNPLAFLHVQTGTSAPDSARSDVHYASKEIEIQAGRSGITAVTNDNCCHWAIGFYALSSSEAVTVEQITDLVHIAANPNPTHPNVNVTFTATRDDGVTIGSTNNWHWQPDPGQAGTAGDLCGSWNPCVYRVMGSGTMTVYTDVGSATTHVTTFTEFRLDADKVQALVGDTVRFTPKLDGVQINAARWRWKPDSATVDTTTSCTAADSPCKKVTRHSGTMWAYLSSSVGQGDSAGKHVSVGIPCPTSDSTLNHPEIRDAFMLLIQKSGPDLQPGDGIANGDSVGNKREHAGWIFKTTGGDYYFAEDTLAQLNGGATECYVTENNPNPYKRSPSDIVVAHAHTHPTHKGKAVYGGCPVTDPATGIVTRAQRGPWDVNRPIVTKTAESVTGGGSMWGDWIKVVTANRDEYVITADGEVWRLPPYLMFSEQSSNRLFWKYSGNSNSACNW